MFRRNAPRWQRIFPLVVIISSLVSQIQLKRGEHHLSISGICHWHVRQRVIKKTDPLDPHTTWHQQWGQGIQREGSNDCVGNWDGNAASSSCYSTCQKNLGICEVLAFWVEFLAFRINIKSFNIPSIQLTPAYVCPVSYHSSFVKTWNNQNLNFAAWNLKLETIGHAAISISWHARKTWASKGCAAGCGWELVGWFLLQKFIQELQNEWSLKGEYWKGKGDDLRYFFQDIPGTRKFVYNLLCVSYGMTSLHLQVIAGGFRHWKATMKGSSAEQAVEWRSHFCQKQCSELRGSGFGDDLQALARGAGPRFRSLPIILNL